MHNHVLYSSHRAHTQLPNNLHLWERDQRQHRDFLHNWTVCSTTANRALSKTWCTILKNQEAKRATNALLANRLALTQNMNIMHLKTKVSGSTDGTQ